MSGIGRALRYYLGFDSAHNSPSIAHIFPLIRSSLWKVKHQINHTTGSLQKKRFVEKEFLTLQLKNSASGGTHVKVRSRIASRNRGMEECIFNSEGEVNWNLILREERESSPVHWTSELVPQQKWHKFEVLNGEERTIPQEIG